MTEQLLDHGYVADRILISGGFIVRSTGPDKKGIPAKGTVTFTPLADHHYTPGDPAARVVNEPIVCRINHHGIEPHLGLLIDPFGDIGGVYLPVGPYHVTTRVEHGRLPSFDIVVTAEHTPHAPLWLATHAPLTPAPYERFVVNEQVYLDTEAAREQTERYAQTVIDASATARDLSFRVGNIETMAGLEPGDVTDAQTANLVSQPDTDTRSAIETTIDERAVQVREAPLTPYRFGAVAPSGVGQDNSAALREMWNTALQASRAPEIHLPEGTWVTNEGGLPLVNGLTVTGAGRTATRLALSGGRSLFTWDTVISDVVMESLYLDGRNSSGHLFEISGSAGIHAATFRDMFWNQQSNVSRIWHQDGIGSLIQVVWDNITMQRTRDSSLVPFYIANPANANSNQMRLVRMNGLDNLNTPFVDIESTRPDAYISDWIFHGLVGEQNPAGLVHMRGVNNITFDTATDQDVHTPEGYVDNIFDIRENSYGLESQNITFRHSTRFGSSMSEDAYEIYCSPGTRSVMIDSCNPIPRSRAKISSSQLTTFLNTALENTTGTSSFPGVTLRPTVPANFSTVGAGRVIYDDTSKKLLVFDGKNWRDAMGVEV